MLRVYVFLAIISLAGAGYYYVDNLQKDLIAAKEKVTKLNIAIEQSEASLKLMEQETQRLNELNTELAVNLQKAEQYGDELRSTLQKHNLTHLAIQKPGLIEGRMQNATDKLWDDLFSITNSNGVQQSDAGTTDSNNN